MASLLKLRGWVVGSPPAVAAPILLPLHTVPLQVVRNRHADCRKVLNSGRHTFVNYLDDEVRAIRAQSGAART